MVGDVIRDDDDDDSEEKMKKKLRTKKGSKKVNTTKADAPVKGKAPRKRIKSTKIVIEDDDSDDDKGQENPGDSNPALNKKAAELDVVMNESSSGMYQSDYSMGVPSDSGKSDISWEEETTSDFTMSRRSQFLAVEFH
jgi:hypothetical protein